MADITTSRISHCIHCIHVLISGTQNARVEVIYFPKCALNGGTYLRNFHITRNRMEHFNLQHPPHTFTPLLYQTMNITMILIHAITLHSSAL